MSFVSELIVEAEQEAKCGKCNKEFSFTIKDDVFIYLGEGSIRVRCPHCESVHRIDLNLELVENKDE
jgi:phage FluMu protein Com